MIIVKAEIRNKHRNKRKIKEEIKKTSEDLKSTLSFFEYAALQYKLRKNIRKQETKWKATHQKKLDNLRKTVRKEDENVNVQFIPKIVHNFSTHVLSKEEEEALAYGLDHYIPAQLDKRRLEVEFESFYQNIIRNIPDLPEQEKQGIKTKFLSTFNN